MKCCICGQKFEGYGNNPWPVDKTEGAKCCDACNASQVIPARIKMMQINKNNPKLEESTTSFPDAKVGDRIKLISMGEDPNPIAPEEEGTVVSIDDIGTIHVLWDNGRAFGLVPEEDQFEIID